MQLSDTTVEEFERAIVRLRRVKMATREHLLGKVDLSESQMHALMALHEAPSGTTGDIAKLLCVTSGAATQTVETLVRRGLIERRHDPIDRRIVRLGLTAEGSQLTTSIVENRRRYFYQLLAQLEPAEVSAVMKALKTLAELMSHMPAPDRPTTQPPAERNS